jgi:hypothetical protein
MAKDTIRYRSGYKYQLADEYSVQVAVTPPQDIISEFINLKQDGSLLIKKHYAWDGPSDPAIDTKNFMRGSLVHDALYQLMRDHGLPVDPWRKVADLELKRLCLEDGMSSVRAWWVHRGVRLGGGAAASPESRKPVKSAP